MALMRDTSAQDPLHCLEGWHSIATRLANRYGVTIEFTTMPDHELGEWVSTNRTLYIRSNATLAAQTILLQQLWNYLALGPWAVPAATRRPILLAVPDQRRPVEHEIA